MNPATTHTTSLNTTTTIHYRQIIIKFKDYSSLETQPETLQEIVDEYDLECQLTQYTFNFDNPQIIYQQYQDANWGGQYLLYGLGTNLQAIVSKLKQITSQTKFQLKGVNEVEENKSGDIYFNSNTRETEEFTVMASERGVTGHFISKPYVHASWNIVVQPAQSIFNYDEVYQNQQLAQQDAGNGDDAEAEAEHYESERDNIFGHVDNPEDYDW